MTLVYIKCFSTGSSFTVPYLTSLFEYCLVSGKDFWDVTLCLQHHQVEQVCQRLEDNFAAQSKVLQLYYNSA